MIFLVFFNLFVIDVLGFTSNPNPTRLTFHSQATSLFSTAPSSTTASFIDTELRGAAMRLHTTQQAPKEGGVVVRKAPPKIPHTPTHDDYIRFLVDSQHVFQSLEEFVNGKDELSQFQNTGLERTKRLEKDIEYLMTTYNLQRPDVSDKAKWYAGHIGDCETIPQFMCHYYNFYFAHTAGGLMIGKKMAKLLLEGETLEFYKWDGDVNKIKESVKKSIESLAAEWTRDEKDACVNQTGFAFRGGGGVNFNLSGKNTPQK